MTEVLGRRWLVSVPGHDPVDLVPAVAYGVAGLDPHPVRGRPPRIRGRRERDLQRRQADAELRAARESLLTRITEVIEREIEVKGRLRSLARTLVPAVGDVCSVHEVTADGAVRRVGVAALDEETEAMVRALPEPSETSPIRVGRFQPGARPLHASCREPRGRPRPRARDRRGRQRRRGLGAGALPGRAAIQHDRPAGRAREGPGDDLALDPQLERTRPARPRRHRVRDGGGHPCRDGARQRAPLRAAARHRRDSPAGAPSSLAAEVEGAEVAVRHRPGRTGHGGRRRLLRPLRGGRSLGRGGGRCLRQGARGGRPDRLGPPHAARDGAAGA